MPFRLMVLMAALALAFHATGCGTTDPAPPSDKNGETDTGDENEGEKKDEEEDEQPPQPEPCETEGAMQECEGSTVGGCTPGKRYCDDGFWSACEGRRVPMPGLCDAYSCEGAPKLNEGCECLVGTIESCYEGPDGTIDVGTCRGGQRICEATATGSAWSECRHQVLPEADDCSGRLTHCVVPNPDPNAPPDPNAVDCSCTNGQTRDCGGVKTGTCVLGTQTCANGKWGKCVGALQPADGDDADEPCSERNCAGGMNGGCGECVVGEKESCYTGAVGTEGVGTCVAGERVCEAAGIGGKWGPCQDQQRPLPNCDESCTGEPHPACL